MKETNVLYNLHIKFTTKISKIILKISCPSCFIKHFPNDVEKSTNDYFDFHSIANIFFRFKEKYTKSVALR